MALDGIRVIDLTRVLAGPWATQIMGDLGAEIIKIERPDTGDDTRQWGPPYLKDEDGNETDTAAYFASANRNKKSVALDFRTDEGREQLYRLIDGADVVVENFKVGGLKKYGLDYETLSKRNPRLVMCSITGFGQTGPYAKRPGYDYIIQAMSGLMSVTGASDRDGGEPMKVGVALTDIMTGLYAVIGILAALRRRDETGRGQHIDLSLLDVAVATMANQAMNYLTTGVAPVRMGNAHPNLVPYQVFMAADTHFIIAVGNDGQFGRLCRALGPDHLADDPRFATNPARVNNREALVDTLGDLLRGKNTAEWIALLESANVPVSPINDLAAVFNDPHVIARQMQLALDHPELGTVPTVANPLKMEGIRYDCAPPMLGENTSEIIGTE